MCLYPRLIKNPKYKPNKKNGGHPPECKDKRQLLVPVGCGECIECRRQVAQSWRIRLSEELQTTKLNPYFITLTFNEEKLLWYRETTESDNLAATSAVRLFLERWRKRYKKSLRHWLITELGHEGTERIHLHGIIFCEKGQIETLEKTWGNGFVHIGNYCTLRTINYIIKYVTKIDNDHPNFKGKILCSPGIGKDYIEKGKRFNAYNGERTKEYYRSKEGFKLNLPMYYRNHIYSEEEKEKLWAAKIDKQERYILGTRYNTKTKEELNNYLNALATAQKDNIKNGYGEQKWNVDKYVGNFWKINNKSFE